jgi:hypothetical protein
LDLADFCFVMFTLLDRLDKSSGLSKNYETCPNAKEMSVLVSTTNYAYEVIYEQKLTKLVRWIKNNVVHNKTKV